MLVCEAASVAQQQASSNGCHPQIPSVDASTRLHPCGMLMEILERQSSNLSVYSR